MSVADRIAGTSRSLTCSESLQVRDRVPIIGFIENGTSCNEDLATGPGRRRDRGTGDTAIDR